MQLWSTHPARHYGVEEHESISMKGRMRGSKHWRGAVMEANRRPRSGGSRHPVAPWTVVEAGSHREGGYGVNGGLI